MKDGAPDAYHRPMLRGEFLKHSLLLMVVGASCLLRPGGRPLAAGSAKTPKPPLTEENLNRFIAELRKGLPPDSEALKTRATRDWRALLREQFALTSTQKRALEVLPKQTVQQVQGAIREAIHTNAMFVVRAVGLALWTFYGLVIGSLPVLAFSASGLIPSFTILILKLRGSRTQAAQAQAL